MTQEEAKPWYKYPWAWFVFSIPFLTVIAGVTTYFIAADKPHSMVEDDYFKQGLAINQSLQKQQQAQQQSVAFNATVDRQVGMLTLTLTTKDQRPNYLMATFSHPTRSQLDQSIKLTAVGDNRFIGQLNSLANANWYFRLTDDKQSWLIKSRWDPASTANLTFQPN